MTCAGLFRQRGARLLVAGALLSTAGLALAQRVPDAPNYSPDVPVAPKDAEFMRFLQQQRDDLQSGKPLVAAPSPRPAPVATAKGKTGKAGAGAAPKAEEMPAAWIDNDMARIADNEGMGLEEGQLPPPPTKTVVFISLSMPESTLRALFAQGRSREDVLFVVRGWQPPYFTKVMQKIRSYFPDQEVSDVNVVIDPYPFRVYQVSQVPVFLHQRKGGDWRRLTGEISLDGAIEEIDAGNFNRNVGRSYKIAEPDVVVEFQKRADGYDWEKEKERLVQKALAKLDSDAPSVELPRVEVSRDIYVDPSITLGEDVVAPNGTVAAKAGTQINPLAYMAFSKAFIAFDPDDAKQVAIAKRWLKATSATLLATHLAPTAKGKPTLAARMGQPVYSLSSLLVERMGIVAVPSLVQQQGLVLHITEERP